MRNSKLISHEQGLVVMRLEGLIIAGESTSGENDDGWILLKSRDLARPFSSPGNKILQHYKEVTSTMQSTELLPLLSRAELLTGTVQHGNSFTFLAVHHGQM